MSVWFPAARKVEVRPAQAPPPGAGEVRVAALVSAISQGTEMLVYRGEVREDTSLDLPTLEGGFAFPIKYGYALVGRVVDAGADVALAPGDIVFVHHPHQSLVTVAAELATPLPTAFDPERAALLANMETAVNVVHDAHPRLGEVAVVMGQGVVGLLITALLQIAGVAVMAVDPFAARREAALALGAAAAIEPGEAITRDVLACTDGRGADLVIEASGNPAALASAVDVVAFSGTVVASAWYGTKRVELPLGGRFHRGRQRIVSSQVSTIDPAIAGRWTRRRRLEMASALLPKLPIERLITHRFPVSQAQAAYELIDSSPSETIQVLLTYPDV